MCGHLFLLSLVPQALLMVHPGLFDCSHGPVDYKNFLDGEGFDGGDGQVGVVGDGKCPSVFGFGSFLILRVRKRPSLSGHLLCVESWISS